LEDDGGAAGARALQVEAVSADVDQLTRHRVGVGVRVFPNGLVATADGGESTIEESEERNPMAPSDPMRVTRRTVVTVRSNGRGGWVSERQMFERDQNDRMFLVTKDTEVKTEK